MASHQSNEWGRRIDPGPLRDRASEGNRQEAPRSAITKSQKQPVAVGIP